MGRGKGEKIVTEREGGKPQETLKYREQTEGGWGWGGEKGVGERGKWVMVIEEDTCWDEHWVLYVSDEPWESTPKTKTQSTLYTLYVS